MATKILPQLTKENVERFWGNIQTTVNGCFEWQLYRNKKGYGNVKIANNEYLTHRIAYKIYYGVDAKELKVLHRCDNPPCCNPLHLFLGTDADNAKDRDEKKRNNQPKGLKNGRYTKPECTARGEQNGSAKLSKLEVIEIRKRFANGDTQPNLAEAFKMSPSAIYLIVNRFTWKHIP